MILTGDIEKYGTGFKRIKDWFKGYPNLNYRVNNMQDYAVVLFTLVINFQNKNK